MRFQSGLVLACAMLTVAVPLTNALCADAEGVGRSESIQALGNAQDTDTATASSSHSGFPSRTAVILRFAVQSQQPTDVAPLSAQACPPMSDEAASLNEKTSQKAITVDPAILDKVSLEMQAKLSKKVNVLIDPDSRTIPAEATVITGCITRANAGNAAGRLVGMGVGASHLDVHVVVLSKGSAGWNPIDTFDIHVKGGSLLPPLGPMGLAMHAVRDTHQNLPADAKKLADKILKQLAKDMKAREKAERNG